MPTGYGAPSWSCSTPATGGARRRGRCHQRAEPDRGPVARRPDGRGGPAAAADAGWPSGRRRPPPPSGGGAVVVRYIDPAPSSPAGRRARRTVVTTSGGQTPAVRWSTAPPAGAGAASTSALVSGPRRGGPVWPRRKEAARRRGRRSPRGHHRPRRWASEDDSWATRARSRRGLIMPVQVYPLFETRPAGRRRRGRRRASAGTSRAVGRGSRTSPPTTPTPGSGASPPEEIAAPSPSNRMIGFPYTKLMNSNNDVEQGAALIMCSVETSERTRHARDRWVFLHAGADAHDHCVPVEPRRPVARSPAIRLAGRARSTLPASGSTTSPTSTSTPASRLRCRSGHGSSASDSIGP